MYGYYRFLQNYHRDPVDLDDLFDGMRNIAADNEVEAYLIEKGKSRG